MAQDQKPEKKKKGADKAPEQPAAEKAPREAAPQRPVPPARLKKRYEAEVRTELMKEFGFRNPMQAPKLEKIDRELGAKEKARLEKRKAAR